MTTKITIKHEGPDHHNVKVIDKTTGRPDLDRVIVLKAGQSHEQHIYDVRSVEVSETSDPPSVP